MGQVDIDTVITRFETDAAQAMADLLRMKAALAATRQEHEHLPAPVHESEKAVLSLGERIRGVRGEMSGSMRTANFFARALNDVAPASSLAGEGIRILTSGLIGGFGLGFGIEVVLGGVKLLAEHFKEEAERAEKLATAHEDMWSRIRVARVQGLADIGKDPETWIGQQVEAATAEIRSQIKAKQEELRALNVKLAVELRKDRRDEGAVADLIAQQTALEGVIGSLKDEQQEERAAARAKAESVAATKSATDTAVTYEQKMRELAEQFRGQARSLSRESVLSGMDERSKIKQQLEFQIQDLRAYGADDAATRRAIADATRIANDKLRLLDFLEAKKLNDAKREEQVKATDAEADERDRAIAANVDARMAEAVEILDITADMEKKRLALQVRAQREFLATATSGWQVFSQSVATELGKVARHSAAYERAMKAQGKATTDTADLSAAAFGAMAQDALASIAEQAVVKALWELAEGTAMLALSYAGMPMEGSAAAHFEAAAMYGAMAGIAGGASYAIGSSRGMTRQEREDVSAAEQERLNAMETSKGTQSTETGTTRADQVDGKTVRETRVVVYAGDPFETAAERAAKAARVLDLMDALDLRREA